MCRGNKDSTARGFTTVRDLPFLIHEFIFLFLPDSEFLQEGQGTGLLDGQLANDGIQDLKVCEHHVPFLPPNFTHLYHCVNCSVYF